ncbi:MAG TPA: rRNA maturation RNAse YbeY, partial [Chitinophagaceae bacterium]|nr:rRNA maturation RNAse YbeY [Chitinophagaceae bacterium]
MHNRCKGTSASVLLFLNMATITFHELVRVPWFRQRRLMKATLLELFKKEKVPVGSIDFILCTDAYLLEINQQFLQHDDYTDIISFDLTEPLPMSSGFRKGGATGLAQGLPSTPMQGDLDA